jgi:hypothetical protein
MVQYVGRHVAPGPKVRVSDVELRQRYERPCHEHRERIPQGAPGVLEEPLFGTEDPVPLLHQVRQKLDNESILARRQVDTVAGSGQNVPHGLSKLPHVVRNSVQGGALGWDQAIEARTRGNLDQRRSFLVVVVIVATPEHVVSSRHGRPEHVKVDGRLEQLALWRPGQAAPDSVPSRVSFLFVPK